MARVFHLLSLTLVNSSSTVRTFVYVKVAETDTVGFVREDNQPDTMSLLISCLATLGLCIYSAVHLNVPRRGEPLYRTLLEELKWCIIGLFAPELILYTAWRQLAAARQLRFEVGQATAHKVEYHGLSGKIFAQAPFMSTSNHTIGCSSIRRRCSGNVEKWPLVNCARLLWRDGWLRYRY
jgi:hypothetical protein